MFSVSNEDKTKPHVGQYNFRQRLANLILDPMICYEWWQHNIYRATGLRY